MKYFTVFLIMTLLICTGAAFPAVSDGNKDVQVGLISAIDNNAYITGGDLMMMATNHGVWGRDISGLWGGDYGTFYPFTGHMTEIEAGTYLYSPYYCGGLWVCGIDSATGDTLATISEYSDEFAPGPMSGGTYLADQPEFRTYKLYSDSLAGNPNTDYTEYIQYAIDQGAPYSVSGSDSLPDMIGDQMLWSVYNDANPALHTGNAGGSAPIGLEVKQTVFSFDGQGSANTIFFRFRIANKGSNVIKDAYLTFWSDPDLGWKEDDFVGCDTVRNMGYIYNADNDDGTYGAAPPAIGTLLLQGPMEHTGDNADTAYMWGQVYSGYHQMEMTKFTSYINGIDPGSLTESYDYMRCAPGGTLYTYNASPMNYMYSGDPVAGTGDLETNQTDKKFMVTTGTVTLRPGDSTEMVVALIVASGADNIAAVTSLKTQASSAISFYHQNFQLPLATNDDPPSVPSAFALKQNYPNPFNPETTIEFTLVRSGLAELSVFNILGEKITTLIDRNLQAGPHRVVWSGTDAKGSPVPSGIYFYRLSSDGASETMKMILMK